MIMLSSQEKKISKGGKKEKKRRAAIQEDTSGHKQFHYSMMLDKDLQRQQLN